MSTLPRQPPGDLGDLLAAVDALQAFAPQVRPKDCAGDPERVNLRQQTQTDTVHGNCWQTAVACLLAVPAGSLPDQVAIEGEGRRGSSYNNALQAYLDEHHGLMYAELYDWQVGGILVRAADGLHVAIGPTARTAGHGLNHVVLARQGETVWDPHPSRAGLLSVEEWGVLCPIPASIREQRRKRREGKNLMEGCRCPACAKARS